MTKRVTCSLPNASDNISGVPFELVDDVRVAVVEDDVAELFAGIRGYQIEDVEAAPAKPATPVQESLVPPEPAAEAPKHSGRGKAKAAEPKSAEGENE